MFNLNFHPATHYTSQDEACHVKASVEKRITRVRKSRNKNITAAEPEIQDNPRWEKGKSRYRKKLNLNYKRSGF
jgi:cytidylate kinase